MNFFFSILIFCASIQFYLLQQHVYYFNNYKENRYSLTCLLHLMKIFFLFYKINNKFYLSTMKYILFLFCFIDTNWIHIEENVYTYMKINFEI
jgi:hypothetical protein